MGLEVLGSEVTGSEVLGSRFSGLGSAMPPAMKDFRIFNVIFLNIGQKISRKAAKVKPLLNHGAFA